MPIPESNSDRSDGRIHWLSGAIVTPLNMFVFPFLWYAFLLTAVVFITLKSGHLPDVRKFGFYGVWLGAVTLFVLWQSSRTKRVGIAGGELVVSSYFREERIPFKQVAAVESVWWYWRRLVRIRFSPPSGFGETVYYIPKWAALVALYSNPANQLRLIISEYQSEHQSLAKWNIP